MRIIVVVLGVAVAGLLVVSGALWRQSRAVEDRLSVLEEARSVTPQRSAPAAQGDRPTLIGPAASPADVENLERTMSDLSERVARHETEVREMARAVADGGAPALGRPEFDDAVRGVVERMFEDVGFQPKVAVAAKSGEMPKKPHIDVLTKALSLDDAQSRRFREDLQEVQGELYTLLSEPRSDGPSWMERIVEMEGKPQGDPARGMVFLELMKSRIPGTETTYLEKAVALTTEFRRRTGEYLRPEQAATFASLDVDLFGVRMN